MVHFTMIILRFLLSLNTISLVVGDTLHSHIQECATGVPSPGRPGRSLYARENSDAYHCSSHEKTNSGSPTSIRLYPIKESDHSRGHELDSSRSGPSRAESQLQQEPLQSATDSILAVDNDIYWSIIVEEAMPKGLNDTEVQAWVQRMRNQKVARVNSATREKCGANMNRHVEFEHGVSACARYRGAMTVYVLGEVFSFHLSRILGMHNVPPVVLSRVSFNSSSQWSTVVDEVQEAGWTDDSLASLSLWVDDLGPTNIPKILSQNQHTALTPSTPGFSQLNITQLVELAQYTDLFVFDYLTAHIDRLVIHREGVHSSGNESLYGKSPIHNLRRHRGEGGLWVVDNESGLFIGYSIVYHNKDKWQGFIEEVLHSVCIFRRSTVAMVNSLAAMEDPEKFLLQTVHDMEPELAENSDTDAWLTILRHFKARVEAVAQWIAECQTRL